MGDLAALSDPKFDPKAFINKACADRTGDEPIERCVAVAQVLALSSTYLVTERREV